MEEHFRVKRKGGETKKRGNETLNERYIDSIQKYDKLFNTYRGRERERKNST